MTPLRKRMIEEMQLRNFAPKTIDLYVDNVAKFAKHFGKSPELLGEEEMRQFLVHLVEERKLAWGTYNQALAALRYLYRWVLKRGDVVQDTAPPRPGQQQRQHRAYQIGRHEQFPPIQPIRKNSALRKQQNGRQPGGERVHPQPHRRTR